MRGAEEAGQRVAGKSQEARREEEEEEEVWRENTRPQGCVCVCCAEGENGKNVVEKKRNGGESVREKE